MRKYRVIWLLPFFLISCTPAAESAYMEAIEAERLEKDSTFRHSSQSPLTEEDKAIFQGLSYFPVDPEYKIIAHLERHPDSEPFEMATTTARRPLYRHFGTAHFLLKGTELRLKVYQNLELIHREGYEDYLFIPFRDLSAPEHSYGGGRYLDVRIPENDSLEIDFNKAYNPYCAYNSRYSCPIPPPDNHLQIMISAGEKKFH